MVIHADTLESFYPWTFDIHENHSLKQHYSSGFHKIRDFSETEFCG